MKSFFSFCMCYDRSVSVSQARGLNIPSFFVAPSRFVSYCLPRRNPLFQHNADKRTLPFSLVHQTLVRCWFFLCAAASVLTFIIFFRLCFCLELPTFRAVSVCYSSPIFISFIFNGRAGEIYGWEWVVFCFVLSLDVWCLRYNAIELLLLSLSSFFFLFFSFSCYIM